MFMYVNTTAAAVNFFDATCNSKPEKRVLTNVLQCKLFWRNNNNKVKFYQQLNAMQKLQFLKPNKLLDGWKGKANLQNMNLWHENKMKEREWSNSTMRTDKNHMLSKYIHKSASVFLSKQGEKGVKKRRIRQRIVIYRQ